MKKKKNKAGGAREGAGRKPLDSKKVPVTLYVNEDTIVNNGGISNFRTGCYELIEKYMVKSN